MNELLSLLNSVLYSLLPEVRKLLAQNTQINGVSGLLTKLDTTIKQINQKLGIKQFNKYQQYAQKYQLDYLTKKMQIQNILTENNQKISNNQQSPTNLNTQTLKSKKNLDFMIIPSQYGNILDTFILQYSFQNKRYEILAKNKQNPTNTQYRNSIKSLIIGQPSTHYKLKQKTSSMTSLHKHITNISTNNPPLILPSYLGSSYKYTYIYELQECVEWEHEYYLVDRYLCFIVDCLVGGSLNQLMTSVKAAIFQQRVVNAHDPFQVNAKYALDCVKAAFGNIDQLVSKARIYSDNPAHHAWIQKQHKFYAKQSNKSIKSSLLLMCTYFLLCNYKLAFLVSKQNKHKLSDIVLSIEQAIKPLNFPYSRIHPGFMQFPKQIVGYWGTSSQRKVFSNLCMRLKNQQEVPTILIDLESNTIVYDAFVQAIDVTLIEKLNKHVKKQEKGSNLMEQTSLFIAQNLLEIQQNAKKPQKRHWQVVLQQKLKNSHAYNKIK